MRILVDQVNILPALQSVSRSIGTKSLPVLANVLLKSESGKLVVAATNLEIGVIKRVNAEIEEEGEITVPARTLLEIVSSLTSQKIEFIGSADQLQIITNNFQGMLNGINAQEFPAIPLASEQKVTLKSEILALSLPEITFAAASDEGRPVLTGILTEIKKNSLELVATDGFRLAHKTTDLKTESNPFKALIPKRTFEEVVRLISEELGEDKDEVIEIGTSENQNQMIFTIGLTQLSSRLIEGTFPAWERIVPTKFESRTIVNRQELLKAVKLASVFARNEAHIIKIESKEEKLEISSEAKELGGQKSTIEAHIEGSPVTVAFNSRYLIDALSACSAQQVSLESSGSVSAVLIKPVGEGELEYVIMPIRLN